MYKAIGATSTRSLCPLQFHHILWFMCYQGLGAILPWIFGRFEVMPLDHDSCSSLYIMHQSNPDCWWSHQLLSITWDWPRSPHCSARVDLTENGPLRGFESLRVKKRLDSVPTHSVHRSSHQIFLASIIKISTRDCQKKVPLLTHMIPLRLCVPSSRRRFITNSGTPPLFSTK